MSTEEQRKYWREQKAKLRKEQPDVINARWKAWRDKKVAENPEHIQKRDRANQIRANKRRQENLSNDDTKEIQLAREKAKRKAYRTKYYQTHKEIWYKNEKAVQLKYRFNLTVEQYEELKSRCNNLCEICGKPETLMRKRRSGLNEPAALAVDHCHATGAVRGLLCQRCNSGLGLFNEDVDALHRAIAYLERN